MDKLMIPTMIAFYIFGTLIGSFLNVCIYRIPRGEDIVVTRSHCMSCGYQLKWYDLIPILSFVVLRGKCRKCNTQLSIQYPIIELINGVFYVLIYVTVGHSIRTILFCFLASALIVLSLIDWRTFEIPPGISIFIGILGIIQIMIDHKHWVDYIAGFFSVSVFLLVLFMLTRGQAMGFGDVKLMAATGLLLGWKLNILAFVIGCIVGSVIHLLRMKLQGESHQLAFGPYLAFGVLFSALWGNQLIEWYIKFL